MLSVLLHQSVSNNVFRALGGFFICFMKGKFVHVDLSLDTFLNASGLDNAVLNSLLLSPEYAGFAK